MMTQTDDNFVFHKQLIEKVLFLNKGNEIGAKRIGAKVCTTFPLEICTPNRKK